MLSLLLAFVGLSRMDVLASFSAWVQRVDSVLRFGYHVVSSGFFGRLSVGNTWYRWESSVSSAGVEFVAPWCYALARSWTSSDGWFQGKRPADRRALEGAVAKAGSVASRSSRESRDSRERARTQARRFKLSGFGHRPQAAGPIRASVRGGAPPARLLLQGTFMWRKINFLPMY